MLSHLRIKLVSLAVGLGLCLALALPSASCNYSHCESLRDDLFAKKLKWQQCEKDSDCYKVFGNRKDCTGIFSCDLGVNRVYRNDADRRIASLGEDTVDCMECATPNCVAGAITLCEPVSHQCVLVTSILDGGTFDSTTDPDTGGPQNPPRDAGTR
jgi:hypothetical protein